MSGRDLFSEQPTKLPAAVAEQCCGTCAHAWSMLGEKLGRQGYVACDIYKAHTGRIDGNAVRLPFHRGCDLKPSQYIATDFIAREVKVILAISSLEGRRQSIEAFEGLFGKEAADKLREAVKLAWAKKPEAKERPTE